MLDAGRCPSNLTPERALEELLKCRDLYSQEPQHVVKFEPEKLKVLRTSTVPKRGRDLMRPTEAAFLADVSQIQLGAEEVESVREVQSLPRPFWDAILRRGPALLKKFVLQLFDR